MWRSLVRPSWSIALAARSVFSADINRQRALIVALICIAVTLLSLGTITVLIMVVRRRLAASSGLDVA